VTTTENQNSQSSKPVVGEIGQTDAFDIKVLDVVRVRRKDQTLGMMVEFEDRTSGGYMIWTTPTYPSFTKGDECRIRAHVVGQGTRGGVACTELKRVVRVDDNYSVPGRKPPARPVPDFDLGIDE
jgi:hypothetical protein